MRAMSNHRMRSCWLGLLQAQTNAGTFSYPAGSQFLYAHVERGLTWRAATIYLAGSLKGRFVPLLVRSWRSA